MLGGPHTALLYEQEMVSCSILRLAWWLAQALKDVVGPTADIPAPGKAGLQPPPAFKICLIPAGHLTE